MTRDTFTCSIITPEAAVYSGEVTFVVVPAHDGEMGFMRDRAPLLARLGIGSLRLESRGQESGDSNQHFFVDGGFAEMVDNQLTVLTEQAIAASDLDATAALAELTVAQDLPAHTSAEVAQRDRQVERAKAKVKLAN